MEQATLFLTLNERPAKRQRKPKQITNKARYINQTSGAVEYYTPQPIVAAARCVMGSIDLDPASSVLANQRVQADQFYTQADDGLVQRWFGNVWLNHPFGRAANPQWITKLCTDYTTGNIRQACCITFAATSEQWFQPLFAYPMCFLVPRTDYYLPSGKKKKGVTKGSVVTYLGPHLSAFVTAFTLLGRVMLPATALP